MPATVCQECQWLAYAEGRIASYRRAGAGTGYGLGAAANDDLEELALGRNVWVGAAGFATQFISAERPLHICLIYILVEPVQLRAEAGNKLGDGGGLIRRRGEVPGEASAGEADSLLWVNAGRSTDGSDEWASVYI